MSPGCGADESVGDAGAGDCGATVEESAGVDDGVCCVAGADWSCDGEAGAGLPVVAGATGAVAGTVVLSAAAGVLCWVVTGTGGCGDAVEESAGVDDAGVAVCCGTDAAGCSCDGVAGVTLSVAAGATGGIAGAGVLSVAPGALCWVVEGAGATGVVVDCGTGAAAVAGAVSVVAGTLGCTVEAAGAAGLVGCAAG